MPNAEPSETSPSRVILVSGAGSGIGRATALRLSRAGHRVILAGRKLEPLKSVLEELAGEGHLAFPVDMANPAQVAGLFSQFKAGKIVLGGIAHCAGIHWLRPIQTTSGDNLTEMLDSHLKSTLLILREPLKQRLLDPAGSSIVLVSSAAALQGGGGAFAYSVAKGGLLAGARTAAVELARRNVRVNVVLPGVVDTPQSQAFLGQMPEEQQEAIRKDHLLGIGAPDDVAAAIEFLLSDGARWITGTSLVVDGGLTAH